MPALEKLLDEPAPDAPFKQGGKWLKRELVRVNHLRNCLLCHASSAIISSTCWLASAGSPVSSVMFSSISRPIERRSASNRASASMRANTSRHRLTFSR